MSDDRLVLVVEDDQATRAFLLDNLAADGFRAAGAGGVGEALRAIEVRRPALVVLDLCPPRSPAADRGPSRRRRS